jgi:PPOX class probable F420-dependent enzyme
MTTNTTTVPESHQDLVAAEVATLATIGPDGRPQLSAVWFLVESGVLRVSLTTSRQKTKNLQHNPACNLFILDRQNPNRYLEVRGDADVELDDDYAFANRLGSKYDADLREMDGPGAQRVVVTVRPVRINAVDVSH